MMPMLSKLLPRWNQNKDPRAAPNLTVSMVAGRCWASLSSVLCHVVLIEWGAFGVLAPGPCEVQFEYK